MARYDARKLRNGMKYEISNEFLKVKADAEGAILWSVTDKDGFEYIWQGDDRYWNEHGANLFPYIARLWEKSYIFQGKTYHMDIHGFLPYDEMELVEQKADSLTLRLVSSPETRKQYPFEFTLDITWKLEGEKITITYQVKNTDDKKMYFGIGGHPGFQIPIEKNLKFEDYRIDFGEDPKPRRILFSEDCFVLEEDEAFALEEGRYLNLEHNLFDDDAIVLKEMPREVTLESAKGSKKITVAFPDMDYLGIWHWPHVEVDYVCIEPWSSLPSRKNVVEDLEKQADLLSLESGQEYTNTWSITIKEK